MNMQSRKQYLQEVQKDYLKASKKEKEKLLDEAEHRTGLARKYLIRRLAAKTRWEPITKRAPRPSKYGVDLLEPLVRIWDIFDEPCSERLVTNIADELDRLRGFEEIFITDSQANQLKRVSARTIDRLLENEKSVRLIAKKYEHKNLPILYERIKTKLSDEWNRNLLGQIQADGVEHCGQSAQGNYLVTISTTDIGSHWWEGEVVMGKGQTGTLNALKETRKRFPFDWKEIHPDNGSSFINYFLYDYTKETNLEFSRSRPYKKNDNCFIEQKNSKNVRQVVGHVRYDNLREQAILNDLYRNELRFYKNYFQAIIRLEVKTRDKGHIYRKYQKAQTPYMWLMNNPNTPKEVKEKLKAEYANLNPAELKRRIQAKIKLLNEIYAAKHNPSNDSKVTFSFGATTEFRLPTLMT